MKPRAAIYCRMSRDREGAGLGIDRQADDCRKLARRLGFTVTIEHSDNDISAYTGKPRPGYLALLSDITAGRVDVVLAWHTDRLHRSPTELETYIDVCEPRGVPTHTVKAGPLDLATPSGRMAARIHGAVARYEVEHMIERQQTAKLQAATAGRWKGGRRPFGYAADGVTVVPAEAAEILRASEAVLRGVSLRRLAAELNERRVPTSTGKPWRQDTIRKVLVRPRNAGLMEHRGEVVGEANWPAIVPVDVWRGVVAVLSDPARRTQFSAVRRWMGSGLYRCYCGETVRATSSARPGQRIAYTCAGGTKHMTRVAEEVDEFVSAVVIERLSRPDARHLTARPGIDTAALHTNALALRAQLDELAAMYARRSITASQLETGSRDLRAQLDHVEAQLVDAARGSALVDLVGAVDLADRWSRLDLDRRRAVIDELMMVTLLPSRRGRRPGWQPGESYFDPQTVRIDWRHDDNTRATQRKHVPARVAVDASRRAPRSTGRTNSGPSTGRKRIQRPGSKGA